MNTIIVFIIIVELVLCIVLHSQQVSINSQKEFIREVGWALSCRIGMLHGMYLDDDRYINFIFVNAKSHRVYIYRDDYMVIVKD